MLIGPPDHDFETVVIEYVERDKPERIPRVPDDPHGHVDKGNGAQAEPGSWVANAGIAWSLQLPLLSVSLSAGYYGNITTGAAGVQFQRVGVYGGWTFSPALPLTSSGRLNPAAFGARTAAQVQLGLGKGSFTEGFLGSIGGATIGVGPVSVGGVASDVYKGGSVSYGAGIGLAASLDRHTTHSFAEISSADISEALLRLEREVMALDGGGGVP